MLSPGALLFGDNPMHQAEIRRLLNDILPNQHWISGWSFDEFAGYPLYLYHYVLGPYLVAATSIIVTCSVAVAYKFWVIASFALAGWSIYLFLQKWRPVGAAAAWSLSAMFLLLSPLPQNHALGMWNFTLGVGLLMFTWTALLELLERATAARFVKTAFFIALMPLVHPYIALSTLLICGLASAVHFIQLRRAALRGIAALAAAGVAGGILASFYIIPFLTSRGWGSTPSPPTIPLGTIGERTLAFLGGFLNILFDPLDVHHFTAAGGRSAESLLWQARFEIHLWGPAAARAFAILLLIAVPRAIYKCRERDFIRNSALAIFLCIVIFQLQWWRSFFFASIQGTVLQNILEAQRFVPIAWLAGFIMIADMTGAAAVKFRICIILLSLAGVAGGASSIAARAVVEHTTESAAGAGYHTIQEGFAYLRKTSAAARGRLAVETPFQQAPIPLLTTDLWCYGSHIFAPVPVECGWRTFGAWCAGWLYPTAELALTEGDSFFGGPAKRLTKDQFLYYTRELNIEKLLLRDGPFVEQLKSFGAVGAAEWSGAGYGIYTITGGSAGYLQSERGSAAIENITFSGASVAADFVMKDGPADARLSLSYHPSWRAALDGAPVELHKSELGLIKFNVPGPGKHHFEMNFAPPRLAPAIVSIAGALLLIGIWTRARRAGNS